MKLRLDECVPRRLKRDFIGYDVFTVREAGFSGLKNGELLKAAQAEFNVLITADKNLIHQQNTGDLTIAIIVLSAFTNRYQSLAPLVPNALEQLNDIVDGQIVTITE